MLADIANEHQDLMLCTQCQANDRSTVGPSAIDNRGQTVLHYAAQQNTSYFSSTIVENQGNIVDVNAQDLCGQTPLHLAVQNDNMNMVLVLLGLGANVNIADNNGSCVLDKVVDIGSASLVQLLIQHGASYQQ